MPFSNRTRRPDVFAPETALLKLREGNFRFVNNMRLHHELLEQVDETKDRQLPFAAILSCMDSRTAAELIFDQGLGDIFSIRIAGNVCTESIIGSLEYATAAAGSCLILVMGHTNCGAIKGAVQGVELGKLGSVLHRIDPAIREARAQKTHEDEAAFLRSVAVHNAVLTAERIYSESIVIRSLVDAGRVGIVPALYDVATGCVHFYPEQSPGRAATAVAQAAMVTT